MNKLFLCGLICVVSQSIAMDNSFNFQDLINAISTYNADECKVILERQPDLAEKHECYEGGWGSNAKVTALYHAVKKDNLFAAKLLLSQAPFLCNTVCSHDKNTPLHMVCSKSMAKLLLKNGADISVKNTRGEPPLYQILFSTRHLSHRYVLPDERRDIAHYVIAQGASTNDTIDKEDNTLLHYATQRSQNLFLMVNFLLAHGANPYAKNKYEKTPTDLACLQNWDDILEPFNIQQLWSTEVDIYELLKNDAIVFRKLFAAQGNYYIKDIIENSLAKLFVALQNQQNNGVKGRIFRGNHGTWAFENVTFTDLEQWLGEPAITCVREYLHNRCMEALSLTEPHTIENVCYFITARYLYVLQYDKNIAFKILLSLINNKRKDRSKDLKRILLEYSIGQDEAKFDRKTLDISGTDENGNTLLHHAIRDGDYKIMMLLLKYGVPFMTRNMQGQTARDCAQNGAEKVLDQIFMDRFLSLYSYQQRYKDAKEYLKQCFDINFCDKEGSTLLHSAVQKMPEQCSLVLKCGVPVNMRDCKDKTPLFYVLKKGNGNEALVELLLKYGAIVTLTDIVQTSSNYVRNMLQKAYDKQYFANKLLEENNSEICCIC